MGIGSIEMLVLLGIAFVLLRGVLRPDLFAYAHKYRGHRARPQAHASDGTDLNFTAVIVLIAVAAIVLAVVKSAN